MTIDDNITAGGFMEAFCQTWLECTQETRRATARFAKSISVTKPGRNSCWGSSNNADFWTLWGRD